LETGNFIVMPNIDYLGIFKDSWHLTWKKKYLWWFGLLASFSSGVGNVFNYSGSDQDKKAVEYLHQNVRLSLLIIFLFAAIFLALFILGIIGRGALIKSIDQETKNKSENFKSGFKEGKKYFWRLFLLSTVLFLLLLVSIIVLAVPVVFLFYQGAQFLGALLAVFAVLIFIPLVILVYFARIYGYLYIVLGKLSPFSALEAAYSLFSKNILSSIILALLFIPVTLAMGLAILSIVISTGLVFLIIGLLTYTALGQAGAITIISLAVLFFLAAVLFLQSIYETFAQTAWIKFFYIIASPKETEPVESEEPEKIDTLPVTTPANPIKTVEIED
jgi:hypothetical protein